MSAPDNHVDDKVYQFSAANVKAIRQEAQERLAALGLDDKNRYTCLQQHGFVLAKQFCSPAEYQAMREEMQRLVDMDWDPAVSLDSFGTDDKANTARGDYFLESADKIHFFAEPTALETNAATGHQVLKAEFDGTRRMQALNKVGHALHLDKSTAFGQYFRSAKLAQLVKDELKWQDPVVPQSMYIFKQALQGGAVNSHQDSTFLFTTPRQTCLGLWLALDDSTVENGCLWVRPGSHKEAVRRQYCRNPDHFGSAAIEARSNEATGDTKQAPKFIMQQLDDEQTAVTWEGKLPDGGWSGLFQVGFVPIECQAGDLVVFTGTLDHLSLPNFSDRARHTFQLHLVEGPDAGVTWSPSNWLQYPSGKPFVKMTTTSSK